MSQERLRPARPEGGERAAYGPRLPWKWIIPAVSAVTLLGAGYWYREHQKQEALRSEILEVYNRRLGPVVERYRGFRAKIERWVTTAATGEAPETHVDPRLRISALHTGQGIYLRLRIEDAATPEGIERGVRQMVPDAITRCLGITPISLRGFYEQGTFLMPGWIDRAAEADGMMRLRVIDDELARRTERDLPGLLNAVQSQYFLLILEHGENRRDHPVDVYMWDLAHDRQLLRLRAQANGLLIPVRVAFEGTPPSPRVRPNLHSGGANDCSIAAQIKELTGEPAMTFGSEMPEPEPEETAPEPGGGTEGAEAGDGEPTGQSEPAGGGGGGGGGGATGSAAGAQGTPPTPE